MGFRQRQLSFILLIFSIFVDVECPADTHYVSLSGTNNSPFLNWSDAATNPIWAVSAASANDTVLVSNGVYYITNQIYSASAITLKSLNGRDNTILDGMNGAYRCAYVEGAASVFDGFTVTNYNYTAAGQYGIVYVFHVRNCLFVNNTTIGGCVRGYWNSVNTVTNCIFKNNTATLIGVGVFAGAGVASMTVAGCRFEGNKANANSGGACDLRGLNNVISNCVIINNSAPSGGGGIVLASDTTNNFIVNCTITGNVTATYGGGIYVLGQQTAIRNCSIIGNIATNQGGGIWGTNVTIQNCLIARNSSVTNIGGGIWMTNGIIESCTIVSNYAAVAGGGVYVAGPGSKGTNNVIYFNTGASAANFTNTAGNTGLNYSCVIPAVDGTGNITNNPVLKNLTGGDYHLRMTSPCVNVGTNQSWMTGAVDLEGNPRILNVIVDMGAYETRIWQGTIYSVP